MNIIYLLELITIYISLLFMYFNIFIFLLDDDKKKLKEYKEWPKVSIIVPAYNEEKNIEETIKSLLNLDYDKDKLEIIIVDDGSKDKTYEIAKKYESNIVKVYRKENGGKASALNYGIKRAKGDFIVTLDADSIVPKDALKKMLRYFDDDVYAVVPSLQVLEKKGLIQKMQSFEYSYDNALRIILSKINSLFVTPGPFSIFRREVFEKIGYFDENNITEDMEIAMRMQAYGLKIVHCPEVLIKTKAPENIKGLLRQRVRWYLGGIENMFKYRNVIKNFVLTEIVFGMTIIFIFIPFIAVGIELYSIAQQIYNFFQFLSSINYNIFPIIHYNLYYFNFSNYINLLSEGYYIEGIFISVLGIAASIIFIELVYEAWKYEKNYENIRFIDKLIEFIPYIYIYPFIYITWWILIFYYKLFGKELRWGGVRWNNSLINKIKIWN